MTVVSAFLPKAPAARGAEEAANGHREGVHDRDRRIEADLLAYQVAPQELLGLPKVGALASESGAVDLLEGRKPLDIVALKCSKMPCSVSNPKNSPTIFSIVRTSESESLVFLGPRLRRGGALRASPRRGRKRRR